MEEDEDTLPMSPFWVPKRRRLRRSYSLILTSTSLFILLLIIVLVFSLIVVPTLRSFTSNIFRPQAVKNGWDSLNLVLVLFAVVCAFLSKNDTNETQTPRFDHGDNSTSFANPSMPSPPPWYEYSSNNRSFNRLRSFGSHPDLRQYSPWVAADERCRFYDDTNLILRHRILTPDAEEHEIGINNVVPVTSVEAASSPPPQPPSPPPSVTQRKAVRRTAKRIYEVEVGVKPENGDSVADNSQLPASPPQPPSPTPPSVTRRKAVRRNVKRTLESNDLVAENSQQPPLPPHPQSPSPAPPPVTRRKAVRRNNKRTYEAELSEKLVSNDSVAETLQPPQPPPPISAERMTNIQVKKKRGIATMEFLTSLKGKKKKQRQRSIENFDNILSSEPFPLTSQPPSPPPPPPPPSVFHNLFSSKKSKDKKHYLVPVATDKPKLSSNKREHSIYGLKDNVKITGNESPLLPIPPPPPPPPFKLAAWKFRVQGDFVRVDSIGSSRSGSPDLDEFVESPTSQEGISQCNSPYAPDGEVPQTATATSLFCPSPDVDTKAHNFIENFRAGLRMARMNSMKERQGIGRSNLGLSPNPQN